MNNRPFTAYAFQQFLQEHKLMGTRSKTTGKVYVPPRPIDPETQSEEMEWVALSGKGELVAFTAVHIAPTAMIEAGYDRTNPYITGIVQLEEGPMMSAQIIGLDPTQPATIQIGIPLTVAFVERGSAENPRTFLAFTA